MDSEPITGTDKLLLRCLEGVATDAEYEQAWRWVHQSSQNRAYYSKMRNAWIASDLLKPVNRNRQEQVWSQLEKKIQPSKASGKTIRMQYLKWATAAAVIVFAYILGKHTPAGQGNAETARGEYTIEAPKGGKSVMTLSDGSKVWLNAGSTLLFDKAFGERNRTLSLHGEAYFEVARDAEHPFLVETSGIIIAALGTAFNVKAYPEDDMIETTLVEGSVRIETNAQSKTRTEPVVLEPDQKAVFYKSRQAVSVNSNDTAPLPDRAPGTLPRFRKIEVARNVDVEISTSWKDKRWIVLGERLGTFAVNIERKYDVVLVFDDTELQEYKISATLEEETIEQLLNAIRLTVPMDYRIERNRVFLKINHQLKKKYDKLIQNR
jgi:ferric-dicitrate binding protein FerR (iron transport regulator)